MEELIEDLGLQQVRRSYGYLLSGGERRRVEIARSLVISPSFILLDEPFSGIDPLTVIDIQKIIVRLKESGIGVLVTDHNVRETLQVTDRAYIINNGRIFRAGSPEELGNDAEVRARLLGRLVSPGDVRAVTSDEGVATVSVFLTVGFSLSRRLRDGRRESWDQGKSPRTERHGPWLPPP